MRKKIFHTKTGQTYYSYNLLHGTDTGKLYPCTVQYILKRKIYTTSWHLCVRITRRVQVYIATLYLPNYGIPFGGVLPDALITEPHKILHVIWKKCARPMYNYVLSLSTRSESNYCMSDRYPALYSIVTTDYKLFKLTCVSPFHVIEDWPPKYSIDNRVAWLMKTTCP